MSSNQRRLKNKSAIITTLAGLTIFFTAPAFACQKPKPGTYSLGWGTARLVVPAEGRPYQTFRTERVNLPGKYCLSGDNVGVTRTESNGKVWAYTPSPD